MLGPLEVRDDGRSLPLGGHKQRALLAILLLRANEVVSTDTLIDGLWGDHAPKTAATALQGYVSNLRKLLSPERIETRAPGYLLRVEPEELDLNRFARLVGEAGREPEPAAAALGEALTLWRGQPLADFAYHSFAQAEIARLEELRLNAIEELVDSDLQVGRHAERLGELQALVAEHPLRERLRAQLMLAFYRSDRQADALAAYEDARRTMIAEVGVEPGKHLRDLHSSILRQAPELALRLEPARTSRLPPQPTPFLGRSRELAEIVALLQRYDVRLLTLTGAGGSGKTRLAVRAAAEVTPDYPDGAFWVPLASLRDPALVPWSIAEALGAKGAEALIRRIGERRMLLVVDNCEHLLDAGPGLAQLLISCPNLKLLVTSREPLHLAAEHEYVVPTLSERDAILLFRQRAQQAEPVEAALAICRRLDCLPLAVELAAARTKLLPPEALLKRLEQRLPLLTRGPRDAPERQRTLEATIAWSYDLLSVDEQRLFTRLAVFVDGCTLAAAEEVCEAELDTLQSLVDKNLLRREDERFHMLQTIHEYAAEQLAQTGDEEEYDRRHAQHYLEWADEFYDQRRYVVEPDPERRAAAAAWFTAERENLRAAFAFFIERGDTRAQLSLGGSAHIIWTGGRVTDGRRVLAQLLRETTREGPEARRRVLRTASWFARLQGDREEALRLAEEALAAARRAGDACRVIEALAEVHICAVQLGDLDRVRAAAEEGEQRARELEQKQLLIVFIATRAEWEATCGNLAVATEAFRDALALHAEIGAGSRARGQILLNLGQVAVEEGELLKASALFDEAVDLFRGHVGPPHNDLEVAEVVEGLASIAVQRDEPAAAARLLGAAHACREADDVRLHVWPQRIHDRTLAGAQAQLSADDFTRAFTEGAQLMLDEAVEYARSANFVHASPARVTRTL